MDHLPEPVIASYKPPSMPYFCDEYQYDGLGFSDFPNRCGLAIGVEFHEGFRRYKSIVGNDGRRLSSRKQLDFLQSWLFFGLLSEIFGVQDIRVNEADFIRDEDGRQFTTTAHLPAYLDKFYVCGQQRGHDAQVYSILDEALRTITKVAEVVGTLPDYKDEQTRDEFRLVEMGLCVQILGESLELAIQRAMSESASGLFTTYPSIWTTKQIIPFQRTNWKIWCYSERGMLHSKFDTTTLQFASTLMRDTHALDHSTCNENHCFARQVDEENYQRRHVFEGCDCLDLEPNITSVIATIEAGGIPCIQLSNLSNHLDTIEISVVGSSASEFVAISHVWADGLGNPERNSMYTCQLLRLKQFVLRSFSPTNSSNQGSNILIWIDTLCIPVETQFQHYRKAALSSLHRIYSTAYRVFVLDCELVNSSITSSLEEKLVRVCISGWMRRLWTLQEGVLGRGRLRFVLRDGVFSLPDEIPARYHTICLNAAWFIDRYLPPIVDIPLTGPLRHTQQDVNGSTTSFAKLFASLLYRSTSKIRDETICFASLLNFDTNVVRQVENTDIQMRAFVQTLQKENVRVPERFIFTGEDKVPFAGYQWAPASFMDLRTLDVQFLLEDYAQGRLVNFDEKGIYIRSAGFSIKFDLEDTSIDKWIEFRVADSVVVYTVYPRLSNDTNRHSKLWEERVRGCVPSNPVVLISSEDPSQASVRAVLVSLDCVEEDDEGSIIHFTSLLSPVDIWVSGTSLDEEYMDLKAVGYAHGQSERWCIG